MTRNSLREMEFVGSLFDEDVAFMEEAEAVMDSTGGACGAWAASEAIRLNVSCPGCKGGVAYDAWRVVNARESPELAERLVAGTLFEFTCPHCGYVVAVVHPCLYLDPEHDASLFMIGDERLEGQTVEALEGVAGSVKRIVRDCYELRTKAMTIAHGLDDRAIELLKLAIVQNAKDEGMVPRRAVCRVELLGIGDDMPGPEGNFLVFRMEADGGFFDEVVDMYGYWDCLEVLGECSLVDEAPYRVDGAWAETVVRELRREGLVLHWM